MISWNDAAQAMLNQIPIGIVLLDLQLKVQFTNSFYRDLTGENLPVGSTFPDRNPFFEYVRKTWLFRRECRNIKIRLPSEKMTRSLVGHTAVIEDMSSTVIGQMLIVQDMTEFMQLQQEYYLADRMTLAGKLAAGTVHEIRNPLTVIQGFLTMLRDDLETMPNEPPLASIRKHIEHLKLVFFELQRINRVLGNFLVMNKNFAERPFTRIELRQVMSEIMPLLENEAILQDIMLQYEEPSGEAVFMGDNEEFKQVILNIVKNAFEATGPGGSVHVYVREKDEMLDVAIEDDGCGIPEEIMDQVLTPFFTTKADGTGLGLSICQKIINSFGGRLEIESRPGRTVVHILLPKASSKHNDD